MVQLLDNMYREEFIVRDLPTYNIEKSLLDNMYREEFREKKYVLIYCCNRTEKYIIIHKKKFISKSIFL